MANPEHLEILQRGVDEWNRWREEHRDVRPDLREAVLQRAKLAGADLSGADLRNADLREADLSRTSLNAARLRRAILYRANLSGADLGEANVRQANLIGVDLREANLGDADLSGALLDWAILQAANLDGANLGGASLRGANLTDARVGDSIFGDVDLSAAKGLETVLHEGPSSIGIDTIYRSRGTVPEIFLRGCGLPEEFIAYVGSLVGRPIEFYTCFLSYSARDQQFAERLCNDLQANGTRCWYAPHDLKSDGKPHPPIDEVIRLHDKVLLIVSEHSLNSEWAKSEIAVAREREKQEKKQMLYPVALAPMEDVRKLVGEDRSAGSPRELCDFSNWKDHDAYRQALQRLLKELKVEQAGRTATAAV